MNWTDGITCSILRDGDAVAEVVALNIPGRDLWQWTVKSKTGRAVCGGVDGIDAAKLAAERAFRKMRGEDADE